MWLQLQHRLERHSISRARHDAHLRRCLETKTGMEAVREMGWQLRNVRFLVKKKSNYAIGSGVKWRSTTHALNSFLGVIYAVCISIVTKGKLVLGENEHLHRMVTAHSEKHQIFKVDSSRFIH